MNAVNANAEGAVALANTAYSNSNIDLFMVLAEARIVNYDPSGKTASTQLSDLSGGSAFAQVRADREGSVGADFVSLVTTLTDYCGIGYVPGSTSFQSGSSAYSVTHYGCISGHTFTHEVGHNMVSLWTAICDSSINRQ